jgi:ORF6N domain
MSQTLSTILADRIERSILLIRGHKVMLDADLAVLYRVSVGRLNEAVKRNRDRFPDDFMFQLSEAEFRNLKVEIGDRNLKSQIAISSSEWGGRRHPPYAFTEQGVAMLSSVLRSKRAVQVNIEIMRAFVRLRQILASNTQLARKLDALEKKYDTQFKVVFQAIRELMTPPEPNKRKIGFVVKERAARYGRD